MDSVDEINICELINDIESVNMNCERALFIRSKLELIRFKVERMEQRLIEYRMAIEKLGFKRI